MNDPLLTVFTDLTCSSLKEGVTDEEIDALESETFRRVAHALKDNTYDEWEKDFRIREYKAYSNIDYWATRLQTKKYSNLDNPTGIYVNKDEEIIVLVGNIPEGQKYHYNVFGRRMSIQAVAPLTTTSKHKQPERPTLWKKGLTY